MKRTMRDGRVVPPLLILLFSTAPLIGQSATMKWPDAVAPLAGERTQAEICVSLLKHYGKDQQIPSGQLAYAKAKSDSDAVIAGLLTALATRDTPGSFSTLQAKLASSASGLADFCNSVDAIISTTIPPGQRGVLSALAKIADIESLVKAVSAGVAALYNNFRNDDALTRKIIQTQLEGARWPNFDDVKPAQ
jgi:hypothetical protein